MEVTVVTSLRADQPTVTLTTMFVPALGATVPVSTIKSESVSVRGVTLSDWYKATGHPRLEDAVISNVSLTAPVFVTVCVRYNGIGGAGVRVIG